MKHENWTIAYRARVDGTTLFRDRTSPFTVIPNTWRYWAADPHLVEVNGKTYVFAELYDRILRRGVIGYSILGGEGASKWKVALNMPHHLSYPHLFLHGESLYMIPESYVANEIAVYKAESFPDRWEKVHVLRSEYCAVDSTLLTAEDKRYLLTLHFDGSDEKLELLPLEGADAPDARILAVNDANKRPAGHFLEQGDDLLRPAQDCTDGYGCALNFYRVARLSSDTYEEELIAKIFPDEIVSDLGRPAKGIHTYNQNEHYEVIDLKGYETDILFYITRPIWFIWRRIRKVLGR